MGSNKRKKKSARKQSAKLPTWFFDKDVPMALKREVEDALARHVADNGITVGQVKYNSLTLQDLCASLKLVNNARWRAVEPGTINAAAQPGMKALAAHLKDFKKKRKMVGQMVADLKAAAGDGSQSSQGSAEEGEGEEEEAQACDSDGEPADPKPAYAKGNPHELIEKAAEYVVEKADKIIETLEESAAADSQRVEGAEGRAAEIDQIAEDAERAHANGQGSHRMADQILNNIEAHVREFSQGRQLRITAEEVSRWGSIGERCKRIKFYWDELEKEQAAIEEALQGTPLVYSWRKIRDLASGSSSSESARSQT